MAPIMAAVAQISAAESQADADKFVAKTAADAAITQTNIQADVTRQLSDNQRALSEQNLAVTQQLARDQEDARRERVNLQLAALEKERKAQEAERKEVRAIEQERIDQQIAFAKQQADENLRLAKLSINTQLVAQGLATGVATAGSRGRLTVSGSSTTSTSLGTAISSTTRAATDSNRGADNESASAPLNRGLSGLVAGLAGVSPSKANVAAAGNNATTEAKAQASRALLASVGAPRVGLANAKGGTAPTSRLRAVAGGTGLPTGTAMGSGSGNAFSFSPGTGVSGTLNKGLSGTTRALMSTRDNHNLILGERAVSDLNRVLQSVRSGGSVASQDFSEFFADQEKKLDQLGTAKQQTSAAPFEGAYRPPTTGRALMGRKNAAGRSHALGY
ncbi:MAG: hypothetical protein KDD51_13785 [Bdellovibrionales bacterium]|nr:hypothetical protein [Bdellovibrionales bacterium]